MTNPRIRKLTPADLPGYMDIYLNAYPAGKDLSEECYDKYAARHTQSMEEFNHVTYYGLFEDGMMAAAMKLIDFDINLYGRMCKATGLMALGVHPLHKKKGLAREMVQFFEDYTRESGASVAMLLPFRMDFYRKLGYGCGTKMDEYHIPTCQLPKAGKEAVGKLKYMGTDDIDKVLDCYSAFVRKNHGWLMKFEEEVRDMRSDDEVRRIGYFDGDELKGYAAFTFVNTSDCNYTLNLMDVKELIYDDAKVLKALLGGLRMQEDLAQTVIIRTGEPDFYHLLDSPQDVSGNYIDFGFLQTNISAVGTMYKIVDIKGFMDDADNRIFPPVDFAAEFEVYDELKQETENFVLSFEGGRWFYEKPEDVETATHIKCNLSDFSSLLMGSAEFGGLARLGVMETNNPGRTRLLDYLLHAEQKPFTNTDY
ncbi:MAG: GNAT family N-acetyltransferase [Firmicutes bacterium]|nr:GNAT family N-acetyltransferase [Bacillota bacterium]